MTDPGNPENPQGNITPSDKGKRAFGWYTPPSGEPRKLNLGNDQPHQDQAPATDQETLFRVAAIKCAEMEEKIAMLIPQFPGQLPRGITLNGYPIPNEVSSKIEDIIKGDESGSSAWVKFNSNVTERAKSLGINTNKGLFVGLNTDEKTRKEYAEYAKKNPIALNNTGTDYYFTLDGDYKKTVTLMKEGIKPDPNRTPLVTTGLVVIYESEMTADDFEIAGQALQMLIKRLKPQDKK